MRCSFLQFFTLAFVFYVCIGLNRATKAGGKTKMRNYYLDILLMFDQSQSLATSNYKTVHQGLKEWIDSYLDTEGVEKTQFAAITCYNQSVEWYFSNGSIKNHIETIMNNITYVSQTFSKFPQCLTAAANVVYNETFGHRKNATSLVLWVSDCFFAEWHGSDHESEQAAKLLINKKVDVIFVCSLDYNNNPPDVKINHFRSQMLEFLNMSYHGNESIIAYANNSQLFDSVDKVIPWIDVDIRDCAYTNLTTPCEIDPSRPICEQKWIFEIDEYPTPTRQEGWALEYGKDCPMNGTNQICECPSNGTTEIDNLKAPKDVALTVGLVVGGLILLIIALLTISVLAVRHRKEGAAINRGQLNTTNEHQKSMIVDLKLEIGHPGKEVGKGNSKKSLRK